MRRGELGAAHRNLMIGKVCRSTKGRIQIYAMHGDMYDAITQSVDQCDIRSEIEMSRMRRASITGEGKKRFVNNS